MKLQSMETSFEHLGIASTLIEALKKEEITTPTAIQEKTIPLVLANRDVVGQSETGSGKTLAYLVPLFQKIDPLKRETQALILTPTHELALQVHRQFESLSLHLGERNTGGGAIEGSPAAGRITSAPLIGNVNITRQIERLKERPQLLVGSAGRVLELIQKRKISSQTIRTIVLDEADRLLDEKNESTVQAVIKTTLKDRQLLLFSATLPPTTLEKASKLLKDPVIIRATEKASVAPLITHQYFTCEQRDKLEVLRKLVRSINPARGLIFINKSEEIDLTVERLTFHGLNAQGIHGSSIKTDRKKAMEEFRTGKTQLLVASDLAARGLDIKGVTHIFNLDMPEDPQLYLHRVGRTGRAGHTGIALSIVTKRELPLVRKVENAFNISLDPKEIYKGKIMDSRKKFRSNGAVNGAYPSTKTKTTETRRETTGNKISRSSGGKINMPTPTADRNKTKRTQTFRSK